MKKIILILTVMLFTTGTMFMSCQSSSEKVNQAKEDVVQANQELNQAIKDSIVQFKTESEQQISANEKRIAEFKTKIAKEKKEVKATYENSLAKLEQQNNLLKKNLNDFKDDETEKWESFKTEFSGDMNDLGIALKNFGTNNK
jgi:cell shape-determining protein MreC